MIVAKKHTQRRYLLVYGRWSTTVNYMWLDPEQCCWSTMAAAVYKTQFVFGVSLTKWEAYLLGGKSSQHDQSTRSIIELQTNVRKDFTIMEKAPTRAFS